MKIRTKIGVVLAAVLLSLGGAVATSGPALAAACPQGKICGYVGSNFDGSMYYWTASYYWGTCVPIGGNFNNNIRSFVLTSPGTASVTVYNNGSCTNTIVTYMQNVETYYDGWLTNCTNILNHHWNVAQFNCSFPSGSSMWVQAF